jgi:hypothetical protein
MNTYLITCGAPVSGDRLWVNNVLFALFNADVDGWIVDTEEILIPFDGTAAGLVETLATVERSPNPDGWLGIVQMIDYSATGLVIRITANSVTASGTSFTVVLQGNVYPVSQLSETVTIYSKTGGSAYGARFTGSAEEPAYMEPGFKTVTNAQGKEVVSSLFGIFGANSVIAVEDEIEWDERRYRAIDVQKMRLAGSTHHVEAYFTSVAS